MKAYELIIRDEDDFEESSFSLMIQTDHAILLSCDSNVISVREINPPWSDRVIFPGIDVVII